MRHLSTEEILLQCDGELSLERARHMVECVDCQRAVLEVEALLLRCGREIRRAIPEQPIENRIASRLRLEQTLYPAGKLVGFPLKWPVVYATAAALTFAVFSGYLSTQLPDSSANIEVAQSVDAEVAEAPVLRPDQGVSELAPLLATAQPVRPLPGATSSVLGAAAPSADRKRVRPATEVAEAVGGPELVRFAFAEHPAAAEPPTRIELGAVVRPILAVEPPSPGSFMLDIPPISAPEPVKLLAAAPNTSSSGTQPADALVEGHSILLRANVWREDIRPVWTGAGLLFAGSVESEAVRQRVTRSIEGAAGRRGVRVELAVRAHHGLSMTAPETTLVASNVDRRRPGGAVRSSLLAHFNDAAHRSFQSPQPSLLEAEIDRYVDEIFRSQSGLLAHAYVLENLLSTISAGQIRELEPAARKKLAEVAHFHINAIQEAETRIYDRLSEALPRKFWSYRARERDTAAAAHWTIESGRLLRETLRLETALSQLLSSPPSTVDVSDVNLSCGELLYRIRSRLRHLRAGARTL